MFEKEGNWYKGNLHSHTTISDGMLTPEESVKLYCENGYSFLCLSEHEIFTDFREQFNTENFIILPGIESSSILYKEKGSGQRLKVHHLHGILGTQEMQDNATAGLLKHLEYVPPQKWFGSWDGPKSAQQIADLLRSKGCIVTYNHPIWSRVEEVDFIDTKGILAIEIFNYNTVQESNTGYDVVYWDTLLRRGKPMLAFAADDNHNEGLFRDACGGWIMVKAESLTHDNIITAIMEGNYYSSSGPEIYDWGIKDGEAFVRCGSVNRIHFVAGNHINDGTTILGKEFENSLTGATYKLKGHESYIRAECVDKLGRTAWTNPIIIGEK